MKKYLVLYKAPMDAMQQMAESTPEQQEEGMKAWMDWAAKCGDQLVDMGQPLANGLALSPDGNTPTDGQVTGFSIVQADDMDGANALMQGHPHLGWNAACSIELHETQDMPGM